MNPEDMTLEQLEAEIRGEMGKRAGQDYRTDESLRPIPMKASDEWGGVSEEVAWGILVIVTVALVLLSLVWGL